ncbi:Gfo/Idh/MocA family protein [Hyphomonas sp. UBA5107]|jgi:D-galactose 1-dehydrogenase|uniref:Gfo/Idh/MocA family protein n=1 Tax=Hyphomonas sp. UBA5107 TaxID=1946636 RepID=UPI000C59B1A1|nr:Gfo/Idh/MocA family oxidoreductase [Hyphomonas sp. UBA5107]MAA82198.1 galactose 1-dehydrogenase [Hyphomonas sp.]HCN91966.1 galactose 1-dehydrogenase [Hyphomonas sp.]|tara:strand:- start:2378 stop:3310 length:933 start_codon:yes stop_codon:yes gene_type:complete
MTTPIRIGVVGLGKIATDAHLPAIDASKDFDLAFVVDPSSDFDSSAPVFSSLDGALHSAVQFDAVALCTPPQVRTELCERLSLVRCAILLEKPPLASPGAARLVKARARWSNQPIFAAWHSRFAAQMPAAMDWARTRRLKRGRIVWRENPAKWHPDQAWLWQPGGLGVFDPGINALSMLTALFPQPWSVSSARFRVPENVQTPVAAEFVLLGDGPKVDVNFEFHDSDDEIWSIYLEAEDGGVLELVDGGASISVNGEPVGHAPAGEYEGIYRRFAELVRSRQTDFDISPLEIVADAFLIARHQRSGLITG